MSSSNLSSQLALTHIPNIGDVLAKNLVSYCGGPEKVFKSKKKDLLKIPGIDAKRAESILAFDKWNEVDEELSFIKKNKIETLFYLDENYPSRLKNLSDSPIMLYAKGKMNLNDGRMIAIVGTRHATDYGKQVTESLVEGLKQYDSTIVSGLAYGIDIAAHRAAVKNGMPTVGVLGHGLNRLYPGQHRSTAVKMLENGGLVTEFKSSNDFKPENFPKRNRIVAGMCDATIVIESAKGGGALITAEIASSYNRDVFCIPGNVNQKFSAGTNYFIKANKATLIESAEDVAQQMGWQEPKLKTAKQKELFVELDKNEKMIVDLLKDNDAAHIDSISFLTQLTPSQLAATLLSLEFKGIVSSLPGKMYKLM